MYETFFGLDEPPFRLTPDPRYLFLSRRHREALGHLAFGIRDGAGFIAITGEIGAGKTTLLRSVLRDADEKVQYAYVLNPVLTGVELLQEINHELGLQEEGGRRELLSVLNAFLLEQKSRDRQVVIVVDEAQVLDGGILEQLRMLSNFETETSKLLQIVLVGQPELRELLARPELTQLNQRITVRFHLTALDRAETAEYVRHRLAIASGGATREIFTKGALKRIHHHGRGLPRLTNQICHRALLVAFAADRSRVTRRVLDQAAGELGDSLGGHRRQRTARAGNRWRMAGRAAFGLVVVGAIALGLVLGMGGHIGGQGGLGDWLPRLPSAVAELLTLPATGSGSAEIQVSEIELGEVSESDLSEFPMLARPNDPEQDPGFAAAAGVLEGAFRQSSSGHSAYEAIEALLATWPAAPLSPGESSADEFDLAEIATERGLSYELVDGDARLLSLLDLPVILEVSAGSDGGGARFGLLESVEGRMVSFRFDGESFSLPAEILDSYWNGRAHLFWNDVDGLGPLLAEGAAGPEVERLHLLLRDANVSGGGTGDVFDAKTTAVVAEFQTAIGLRADGKVGPLTMIALYRIGLPDAMPRLRAKAAIESRTTWSSDGDSGGLGP
jgi:general secretion pathway protein A